MSPTRGRSASEAPARPQHRTDREQRTEEPALKADPSAQLKLLDVQELDSRLDALRHQASHPPEGPALRDLESSRASLRDQAADLQIQVDDLTRAQRKADDDVEQVKGRRGRDQKRLDSGQVTNPKDLERLQHELVSLDRRISELEDTELEIMAHLEDAQRDLAEVQAHLVEQDATAEELDATRLERLTGLRAEGAEVVARRKEVAATVPDDLLALYERLREQKNGVGAALLRQRRCGGCSLELNSGDLATVSQMPADDVARCEECGRILVRTEESGLR